MDLARRQRYPYGRMVPPGPRECRRPRAAAAAASLEPVALQLAVQASLADAEGAGGLAAVAFHLEEGGLDVEALEVAERDGLGVEGAARAVRGLAGGGHLGGEIGDGDRGGGGEDDGTLHDVHQLTYVSRPGIGEERLHGLGAEALFL